MCHFTFSTNLKTEMSCVLAAINETAHLEEYGPPANSCTCRPTYTFNEKSKLVHIDGQNCRPTCLPIILSDLSNHSLTYLNLSRCLIICINNPVGETNKTVNSYHSKPIKIVPHHIVWPFTYCLWLGSQIPCKTQHSIGLAIENVLCKTHTICAHIMIVCRCVHYCSEL